MAINMNGVVRFSGAVLRTWEHMWMDGMLEEFADVWDSERQEVRNIQIGYYGADGCNLNGSCSADIDVSDDTIREMIRVGFKKEAYREFCRTVSNYKQEIRKGRICKVVRGRKVKKGTVLEVFWAGEKPTYRSQCNPWMHETELIAGCYDHDGNKVWIKGEYLEPIDNLKSPDAKERRKFVKAYVSKRLKDYGISSNYRVRA